MDQLARLARLTVIAVGLSIPFFAFGTGSTFNWDVPILGKMEITELRESLDKAKKENSRLQVAVGKLNKSLAQTFAASRALTYRTVGFGMEVNREAKGYSAEAVGRWVDALPPNVKVIAVTPDAQALEKIMKKYGLKYKFIEPLEKGVIDAREWNFPKIGPTKAIEK